MSELDFNKLSKVKKEIVRSLSKYGYVGDMTYTHEKTALMKAGWLQSRQIGDNVISGQYMLTDAGSEAFEQWLNPLPSINELVEAGYNGDEF